jgi:hypothetical protein
MHTMHTMHMQVVAKHENANSREYLDSLVESMHKILKMLDSAPSVQFQVLKGQYCEMVFWPK